LTAERFDRGDFAVGEWKEMESLGLYVSIPFCKSKCTYCNFASGVFPLSSLDRYIARLEEDLHAIHGQAAGWGAVVPEVVDTVYLGGGTPSLLSPAQMLRLFAALRREFVMLPSAEVTVECAPGQIEDATLAAMVECGVNRISFGVQSFMDAEAKHTGRLHTREIALKDVERVRAAGIARVNLDLIAGLPGQTRDSWRESLEVLASAEVDHASIYMLEVDEDSRLGREIGNGGLKYYAPQVPTDDAIAEMYLEGSAFLGANGLPQYEISNFARPGAESLHNLKYWTRAPYLGLGLDAHSMLWEKSGAAVRFATTDELEPFLNAAGWEEAQTLTPEEKLEEAWFLGLRLNRGIDLAALRAAFGTAAIAAFEPVLVELECDALIAWDGDRVALTERGRLMSNEVFAQFLADPETGSSLRKTA
jgi:oxygen-independent coproporphyrinogen-3 oxidase